MKRVVIDLKLNAAAAALHTDTACQCQPPTHAPKGQVCLSRYASVALGALVDVGGAVWPANVGFVVAAVGRHDPPLSACCCFRRATTKATPRAAASATMMTTGTTQPPPLSPPLPENEARPVGGVAGDVVGGDGEGDAVRLLAPGATVMPHSHGSLTASPQGPLGQGLQRAAWAMLGKVNIHTLNPTWRTFQLERSRQKAVAPVNMDRMDVTLAVSVFQADRSPSKAAATEHVGHGRPARGVPGRHVAVEGLR